MATVEGEVAMLHPRPLWPICRRNDGEQRFASSVGARCVRGYKRNNRRGGQHQARRAYQQHAAVEPSKEEFSWLAETLEARLEVHGEVPRDILDRLDEPTLLVGTGPQGG